MAESLHEQCMDALVSLFGALTLEGLGTGTPKVYKQKLPAIDQATFPCILVTIEDCTPELTQLTTEHDDKVLPVQVHLMDRADWKDQGTLSPWLSLYEQVTSAVLSQAFTGESGLPFVAGNWQNDIKAMGVLDQREALGAKLQHAVTSFWVRCRCATARLRRSAP